MAGMTNKRPRGHTQTASHIHIRHVQSVWAHWYAVNGHTAAALYSYTYLTWLRFGGTGSLLLVESKWWHNVIVEGDSHLKLLPGSILDIYKVFDHIDMLSIGIGLQPCRVLPTLLGSDFWGSLILVKLCQNQTLVIRVSNSYMLSKSNTLLYCFHM